MINITTGNGLSDFPGMEGRGGTQSSQELTQGKSSRVVVFVGNRLTTPTAFVDPVWKRYNEGDILHAVSQID